MGTDIKSKDDILMIVPLPPPISGASLATITLINYLEQRHKIRVINYAKGTLVSGNFSVKQLLNIIYRGTIVLLNKRRASSAYLVISTTFLGNLRDIFFLLTIGKKLRSMTMIHLHGANFDKYISSAPKWVRLLNSKVLGGIKGAVVLGETFRNIFEGYIANDRVHIVENSVKADLFINRDELEKKFRSPEKINILFLSNLIKEKGFQTTLEAFLSLDEELRRRARLHIAGNFNSIREEKEFLVSISNIENIVYYGNVEGKTKQDLLWQSHIFCLPTSYRYEGQPISILEAYASGCIVVTSDIGGIRDVFDDNRNGLYVEAGNTASLRDALVLLITSVAEYKHMASSSYEMACERMTDERYCRSVEALLTYRQRTMGTE